ncbi:E3 ubiquitin-protein ligase rnf168 [Anarrhichthys ocellatus]|uniref:E3 ubiquitin-protein ligase rnf168 n=1 Tax=Anarrhichthys ocellatus TaxID=433405 RepID=UPI0012EDA951|nr:E3 ubiquitin-protein ligase rnf168-like [Anarrhichthys ocellatus]XP_031728763.1 E3 ubiquitin-protein ligase rnf168-like [Anarrhichthys ocellatus]
MVLCEDGECSVCLSPFSRMDRVPRVLHCRHTFCEPCLETMSQARNGLLTVGCPLCRRVTCIGRGLSLQEALWVNSKLWELIPEDVDAEAEEEEEEEEDGRKQVAQEEGMEAKQQSSLQAECASSRSARTKLKLPAFFRKFSLTKQHQDRIVPGSNVEMKSWRRLSTEDTV